MFWKNRSKEIATLQEKIAALEKLNAAREERIKFLEALRKEVFFLLEESIPVNQTERKRYMGDISLFYGKIFKDKLKHFIGIQLEFLSKLGRTREEDMVTRCNINCFNLIDDWMNERTNEHLGDLQVMRSRVETDEQFKNKFKETYEI